VLVRRLAVAPLEERVKRAVVVLGVIEDIFCLKLALELLAEHFDVGPDN
jgi:hypothetical protein